MLFRVIAYCASVLAAFWFGRESSWPSFFVAIGVVLAYFGAESRGRFRSQSRVAADRRLYAELQNQMPFNPQIRFLRDYDLRGPIDTSKLGPLGDFVHTWTDEAHSFHDKKIEAVRAEMHKVAADFLDFLSLNTWPLSNPTIQKIPDEWRTNQKERYEAVSGRLNGDATKIVGLYEELVRLARKRLNV